VGHGGARRVVRAPRRCRLAVRLKRIRCVVSMRRPVWPRPTPVGVAVPDTNPGGGPGPHEERRPRWGPGQRAREKRRRHPGRKIGPPRRLDPPLGRKADGPHEKCRGAPPPVDLGLGPGEQGSGSLSPGYCSGIAGRAPRTGAAGPLGRQGRPASTRTSGPGGAAPKRPKPRHTAGRDRGDAGLGARSGHCPAAAQAAGSVGRRPRRAPRGGGPMPEHPSPRGQINRDNRRRGTPAHAGVAKT